MANPKYIKLHTPDENETNKKVNKKPYSFRCDETLLDDMNKYAEMVGIPLPQLLNDIMANFIKSKTLTNTYLTEVKGMYINIPSNADENKSFEYEIRYAINNLDKWTADMGYVSTSRGYDGIRHEGIDFLIIPETLHGSKLSDMDRDMLQVSHVLNLNNIPDCLYCIYITVDSVGVMEYEVISWISAINKLKASGRYDIISHGNKIKKELEQLHQKYVTGREICDHDEMVWPSIYGKILHMAKTYNTGAILPANQSIDKIEYTPIAKTLPDDYELVDKLLDENKRLKKLEDELKNIKDMMNE